MIADAMCYIAREKSSMVEQWSEHIRELCGSLKVLYVALELHSRKRLGNRGNVHPTKA